VTEIKRKVQLKQEVLRFMLVEIEDGDRIGKSIKKKELKI
jgi:ribosomal protein S6